MNMPRFPICPKRLSGPACFWIDPEEYGSLGAGGSGRARDISPPGLIAFVQEVSDVEKRKTLPPDEVRTAEVHAVIHCADGGPSLESCMAAILRAHLSGAVEPGGHSRPDGDAAAFPRAGGGGRGRV